VTISTAALGPPKVHAGAQWLAAVTSAPRTPETLSATLESIAAAGWPSCPVIFDRHRLGPWPTFRQTLAWLVLEAVRFGCPDTMLLVFQDDILLSQGGRRYLANHPPPVDGILSLFASAGLVTPGALGEGQSGWYPVKRLPRSYGAQALAMPLSIAVELLRRPPCPRRRTQTDFWISRFCRDRKIPYYVHHPSLVMHIGNSSSLDRPNENTHLRQCGTWLSAAPLSPSHA
jgi:hypothetical protein